MNKQETKEEPFKPLVILGIVIFIIWIISFIAIFFSIDNWNDRASFGDLFGGINALFSGLALAGIIYTIFLQRKELNLQRLELIETRKELHRSAEAQEKSEQALANQADSLKKSSQLTALTILYEYYRQEVKAWDSMHTQTRNEYNNKRLETIDKIESILFEIEELKNE